MISFVIEVSKSCAFYDTVSKQMIERIEKIPTIRFLRYRDISPSLKKAISDIAAEFASLHEDLKSPEMWIRSHLLSKTGLERWERTAELVGECRYVVPDLEWRENWEKKNVAPLCTRLEAELIAKEFIFNNTGIDLSEIDPKDGKLKYYCFRYAKNGCFKLRFGEWGELNHPYNDIGTVVVYMLTKEAEMISPDNGDQ